MDLIDKYQRQVNKLKQVIKEDEDRHKEQLDEALTNLENATTAHAKRTTRQLRPRSRNTNDQSLAKTTKQNTTKPPPEQNKAETGVVSN